MRRLASSHLALEPLEDRALLSVFTVTNTDEDGPGSLQQAVIDANGEGNADVDGDGTIDPHLIRFDIPADDPRHVYYQDDGVPGQVTTENIATTTANDLERIPDIDPDWPHTWFSIQPTSGGLLILSAVVIDGYSQPGSAPNTDPDGFNGVLRIELSGRAVENEAGQPMGSPSTVAAIRKRVGTAAPCGGW